ncbi:DsbA family protein [Zhongshania aliphaticivorans]|jgi:2-hydroxychromene-2-carboxylate isomerase|uniref:2-hydroxychromene-2-carboxylate isomerase n=1 Tax=Zhongshania aliphaticivorans TaxID=1470434 RepID=A0A127M780_9GAMM|nr:DsbA family protein [Zhongshania aliphaticivorans]AMO69097.1 2-hydroxychromene-2-carboxylate isomerase [Zhongshania aliphaticivorans]
MSENFKNQGGVSSSEPSRLYRWLTSKLFMSRLASLRYQAKLRAKFERRRHSAGSPHIVEYFHQVDDGYSHLSAQLLSAISKRYDVTVVCHLVSASQDANAPEPQLLSDLARQDAIHIAPHYGLHFPHGNTQPPKALVDQAQAILARQTAQGFIDCLVEVSTALWNHDQTTLAALAERLGAASPEVTAARIQQGNAQRAVLGHYSGAMFYYGKEWYWGVDRLYHLEARLATLGVDKQPDAAPLAPRKAVEIGELKDNGSLTFEIYPSLRSPYTAIIFDRALKLAADSGVKLVVRPVLPMVMRGVPATRVKGAYIMTDCGREARASGVPFGPIYDPIGDPVRRCYAIYPWACEQGKGNALLSSFLRLAFAEGVNTNKLSGLQEVVEQAGLDWQMAKEQLADTRWEAMVEQNRLAMYEAGLWGVPSFRLLDKDGNQVMALWGQDRLWLFSREIQRLLKAG